MSTMLMIYSIILPLAVLIVPKGMPTVKIMQNCYNSSNMSWFGYLQAYTPFYNSYLIRKALYGSAKGIAICNTIFVAVTVITIALRFLAPSNLLLQFILTVLMFSVIALIYAADLYVHWDLCNLFDSRVYKTVAILMPPLCSYLIANKVNGHFKKYKNEIEGTFDGTTTA